MRAGETKGQEISWQAETETLNQVVLNAVFGKFCIFGKFHFPH